MVKILNWMCEFSRGLFWKFNSLFNLFIEKRWDQNIYQGWKESIAFSFLFLIPWISWIFQKIFPFYHITFLRSLLRMENSGVKSRKIDQISFSCSIEIRLGLGVYCLSFSTLLYRTNHKSHSEGKNLWSHVFLFEENQATKASN